jgi:hypothetical protein
MDVEKDEKEDEMLTIDNDDAVYLQWVNSNLNGFVINSPKRSGAVPDMLHKASCQHITTSQRTNYTTTDYRKICSVNREELIAWGAKHSSNFQECKVCKP